MSTGSSKVVYFVLAVGLSDVAGITKEGTTQPLMGGNPIVITAKPRFAQQEGLIHLIIGDTNRAYALPWAKNGATPFRRVSLDSNRLYAFTVDKEFSGESLSGRLLRIEADGSTIYDTEICEVHKARMQPQQARIVYGRVIPMPDEPSADWEQWKFPHCRDYVLGGCVRGPDSPKTTKVYVCNQCMAAYEKWKKDKASGSYPELALKNISDSKPRLALINDQTMAVGEKAKVRLGEGRVAVECIEIHDYSVTVRVGDAQEVRELELQGGVTCIDGLDAIMIPTGAERLRRSRLALINEQILMAVGERTEVTVAQKRVWLECVEIHDASAIVRFGDDRELRELPARIITRAAW